MEIIAAWFKPNKVAECRRLAAPMCFSAINFSNKVAFRPHLFIAIIPVE